MKKLNFGLWTFIYAILFALGFAGESVFSNYIIIYDSQTFVLYGISTFIAGFSFVGWVTWLTLWAIYLTTTGKNKKE